MFELRKKPFVLKSWWFQLGDFVQNTSHTQNTGLWNQLQSNPSMGQFCRTTNSTRTGEAPFVETRGGAQCQPSLRRRWPVCTGFPTRYPETTRGGRYWVCLVKHWKQTLTTAWVVIGPKTTIKQKNISNKKQKGTYHYNFQSDPPESVFVQYDRYPPVTLE